MQPGLTYHIYTHANGSENLFRNDENFRYFLKRYKEFIPGVADTLAYCLMPNHLHLLVRVKDEKELAAFFKNKNLLKEVKDLSGLIGADKKDLTGLGRNNKDQQDLTGLVGGSNKDQSGLERLTILQFSHLFNAYTKAFNKVYNRRGSLFTRSFKRKEIATDSYYTSIICYIHTNPIRHGFVKQIADWPWSSYPDLLLPNLTPTQQEVINWFGNRAQFIQFHEQPANNPPEGIL